MSWELMKYRAMRRAEEIWGKICDYLYDEKQELGPEERLDAYVKGKIRKEGMA